MTAQEVTPAREQLANAASAGATVHNTGAYEVGTAVPVVAGRVGQAGWLFDAFPIPAIHAYAIVQDKTPFLDTVPNAGDFFAITRPDPIAYASGG